MRSKALPDGRAAAAPGLKEKYIIRGASKLYAPPNHSSFLTLNCQLDLDLGLDLDLVPYFTHSTDSERGFLLLSRCGVSAR